MKEVKVVRRRRRSKGMFRRGVLEGGLDGGGEGDGIGVSGAGFAMVKCRWKELGVLRRWACGACGGDAE